MIKRFLVLAVALLSLSVQTLDTSLDYLLDADAQTETATSIASTDQLVVADSEQGDPSDGHSCPCSDACPCHIFHHGLVVETVVLAHPVVMPPIYARVESSLTTTYSSPPLRPPLV